MTVKLTVHHEDNKSRMKGGVNFDGLSFPQPCSSKVIHKFLWKYSDQQ